MEEKGTGLYVQFGCGLCAPESWINFDASPTLRLQKNALTGGIFSKFSDVKFPKNVLYGDVVKGLPLKENSCKAIYSSHTLEHLPLLGFRKALRNVHANLKPGGTFRFVVPDLEVMARSYLKNLEGENPGEASVKFIKHTLLGSESRQTGLKGMLKGAYGNAEHLWMWDQYSLRKELEDAGFTAIKRVDFGDSGDAHFKDVEDPNRFLGAVAMECRKPGI